MAERAKLVAIAVVARNGVLGDGADQPFKFKEDWAHFKQVTMGHPLIMGRRTHDAMGLLPGRVSIVITSRPQELQLPAGRGFAVSSLADGVAKASELDQLAYVVGGGSIYAQAWDLIDELDLTEVHADAHGDVVLPRVDPTLWQELSREPRGQFDFVRYRRR